MANEIEKVRFRGIEGAVIAEVTKDDDSGITFGEVNLLMGTSEISKAVDSKSDTYYCDNIANETLTAKGATILKLKGTALGNKVKALIAGNSYISESDSIVEVASPDIKYFALGYVYKLTNGQRMLVWNYKGTFAIGDETYDTETDGTDATEQELTYTSIDTVHKFTLTAPSGTGNVTKSIRNYIVPESTTVTATKFFQKVTLPNETSSVATQ